VNKKIKWCLNFTELIQSNQLGKLKYPSNQIEKKKRKEKLIPEHHFQESMATNLEFFTTGVVVVVVPPPASPAAPAAAASIPAAAAASSSAAAVSAAPAVRGFRWRGGDVATAAFLCLLASASLIFEHAVAVAVADLR